MMYRIQLEHCQKFLGNPILLSTLNVSPDPFTHFLESLDGIEPYVSPETFNYLMLSA
jgi:hypothetical protein